MASEHEKADDFHRTLAEHSGTTKPVASGRAPFPFPEYSAKTNEPRTPPVELTEDEKRALTMFGGGSWHAGSSEVPLDDRDVGSDALQPRQDVGIWWWLRSWFGIGRRR